MRCFFGGVYPGVSALRASAPGSLQAFGLAGVWTFLDRSGGQAFGLEKLRLTSPEISQLRPDRIRTRPETQFISIPNVRGTPAADQDV